MTKGRSDFYRRYIESDIWKEKRKRVLEYYGHKCQEAARLEELGERGQCSGSLQVHHRHYRSLARESFSDLMVLCSKHHKEFHSIDRYERKKRERFYIDRGLA